MTDLPWPLSVPVLTDGTVTLRAATPTDIEPMTEMARDPEMVRFTAVPERQTAADSEQFALVTNPGRWDDGTIRAWSIDALDDHGSWRYAGNIDVRDRGVSDVGFALHPWARGRGVMTAAVRLAVQHCFESGYSESVHWRAHLGNLASLRVAHACGFRLVAEVPGLLFERGRLIDGWHGVVLHGDALYPRQPWRGHAVLTARTRRGRALVLRTPREDDLTRLAATFADPVSRHWLVEEPRDLPGMRTTLARWWWRAATGQAATWVVADAGTDEALGEIAVMDLHGYDPTSGEIGYAVHPDARGQGVVTAALAAVVGHALDPDGLDRRRLTAAAAEGNAASLAALRGAGFTPVGRQTAAEPLGDGTYADLHELELLR